MYFLLSFCLIDSSRASAYSLVMGAKSLMCLTIFMQLKCTIKAHAFEKGTNIYAEEANKYVLCLCVRVVMNSNEGLQYFNGN